MEVPQGPQQIHNQRLFPGKGVSRTIKLITIETDFLYSKSQ